MQRRKLLIAAGVFTAGLTALVAGFTLQQYVKDTASLFHDIDDLRAYESHWSTLTNSDPVTVDSWRDKILVLNFWGSWCPPCVEEMPLLDRMNNEHRERGVRVVGVVVDREEDARAFLDENQIEFPSIIADMQLTNEIIEKLGNTQRVLPFTVAFDRSGRRNFSRAGPLTEEDFKTLVE